LLRHDRSLSGAAPTAAPAAAGASADGQPDSLARMFWHRVRASGPAPAQLARQSRQWRARTWAEVGEIVRELALGLLALGLRPGDRVGLLSRTRAEWVQADCAILSAGAIAVPIYPTFTAMQLAHITGEVEARGLVVEDATQLVKVLEVRHALPTLEWIIVIEGYDGRDAAVITWDALRRTGRENAATLDGELARRIASPGPDEVATIVYTSGTTGPPKGVVQTHANHLAALGAAAEATQAGPGDVHLLFLPLAHAFARLEGFMGPYLGLVTAFAESLDRVPDNLREVRPHFVCAVPRFFEKAQTRILGAVEARSPLQRWAFTLALRVGRALSARQQTARPVSGILRLAHRIADRAVLRRLRQAFGGRLRFAVSGGASLARETAEFFHALGLLILEGYGLTETCPVLTFNRINRFRFGSAGPPLSGVELRIASDGEILARGPNIARRGYYRNAAATADAFEAGGWLRTGDVGYLDTDGFLVITDRKKDIIVTSGGANIAPQNLERLLRADPLIGEAMVYGDRRPYPVALLALNPDELARVARRQGLGLTDAGEVAGHPAIRDRVARLIEEANRELPSYARIKRFALLPTTLTEAAGEVTPSLKVRRAVVAERYQDLLESLYR
jgi:long-chain acyl-CoA synthetase